MSEAVVTQGTGLGDDGESIAGVVSGKSSNTTTVETSSQESSSVSRVPQFCDRSLHVGEVAHKAGRVIEVVDGGGLDTELCNCHADLTVGVSLIGLSKNLVDIAGNIRSDRLKLWSVLQVK